MDADELIEEFLTEHVDMVINKTPVMPGLGDNKLAGCKGCIAFVQSPKDCVVAIASGNNA